MFEDYSGCFHFAAANRFRFPRRTDSSLQPGSSFSRRQAQAVFDPVFSKRATHRDDATAGARSILGETSPAEPSSADSPLVGLGRDCFEIACLVLLRLPRSHCSHCCDMSDSSGFDSPRSRHRSEDPNALQRLPSTNSTEVKEMWNGAFAFHGSASHG